MKRGLLFLGLVLLAGLSSVSAEGERVTVQMKNGDRLSGVLISNKEDFVQLKTDMVGQVAIPTGQVKEIEGLPDKEAIAAAEKKAAAIAEAKKESAASDSEAEPMSSRFRTFVRTFGLPNWKKRLDTGLTSQAGRRDKTDFSLRYSMSRKIGKIQHRLESKYYYGDTTTVKNGVSTTQKATDKFSTTYRLRKDLAPGIFYESNSIYSWDAVKEIDLNAEQKFGLGYRIFNEENLKLSTGAGAAGRLRDDLQRDRELDYLVDFFQDLDFRMNKRLRLTQDIRLAVPLEDTSEYEINFRTGLVSDITDSINLTVRYEFEYDRSLAADRREDQRFVSSLGYNF